MITWIKQKHSRIKTKGRYKSGSNDQGTKHANKHKANDAQRQAIRASQPNKVMVLDAATGKKKMITRAR